MPQSISSLKQRSHWKWSLVHGRSTQAQEEEALTGKHAPASWPTASSQHVHSVDWSSHWHRHPSLHVLPNFCFLTLSHAFLRRLQFHFPAVTSMRTWFSFQCQYLQANNTAECIHENKQSLTKQGWGGQAAEWAVLTSRSQWQARASNTASRKTENYCESWKPRIADRGPELWMLHTQKTKESVFGVQSGTIQRDVNQKRYIFFSSHCLGL